MKPAGRQGYPKATIGTPKGDRVDHNWTTPSMEEDRIYCRSTSSYLLLLDGNTPMDSVIFFK